MTLSQTIAGTASWSGEVANTGSAARAFEIGVFYDRSAPPTCADSGSADQTLPVQVAGGQVLAVGGTFTMETPGTYTAWLFVDSGCQVAESDEINNLAGSDYSLVNRLATSAFFGEVTSAGPNVPAVATDQDEVRERIGPATAIVDPEGNGLAAGRSVAVVADEPPQTGGNVPDDELALAEQVTIIPQTTRRSHSQCAVADAGQDSDATLACAGGTTVAPAQTGLTPSENVVLLVR